MTKDGSEIQGGRIQLTTVESYQLTNEGVCVFVLSSSNSQYHVTDLPLFPQIQLCLQL